MRPGDLTPGYAPGVEDGRSGIEFALWKDASGDLKAKYRPKAFLLRHDIRDKGRATWEPAHLRWLAEVVCPTPAQQIVFQSPCAPSPSITNASSASRPS